MTQEITSNELEAISDKEHIKNHLKILILLNLEQGEISIPEMQSILQELSTQLETSDLSPDEEYTQFKEIMSAMWQNYEHPINLENSNEDLLLEENFQNKLENIGTETRKLDYKIKKTLDRRTSKLIKKFEAVDGIGIYSVSSFLRHLYDQKLTMKVTPLPDDVIILPCQFHTQFSKKQFQVFFHYFEHQPDHSEFLLGMLFFFFDEGYQISFHPIT